MLQNNHKDNASCIKAVLIDFWLKNKTPDLIINEMPFLNGTRRADVIMIEGQNLLGFEIKSELDSLKNLNNQISDYKKVFDFVYVVVDHKFANAKEIKRLPPNVGVLTYDKEITLKKEAVKIKKFKKSDLISLLWRKDLETLLHSKKANFDTLKEQVQNELNIKEIKVQILASLKERYGADYKYFLTDRGSYTTVEDLRTITGIKHQNLTFSYTDTETSNTNLT